MKYIDCAIQGPADSQFLVFQEFQERKNESVRRRNENHVDILGFC